GVTHPAIRIFASPMPVPGPFRAERFVAHGAVRCAVSAPRLSAIPACRLHEPLHSPVFGHRKGPTAYMCASTRLIASRPLLRPASPSSERLVLHPRERPLPIQGDRLTHPMTILRHKNL